MALPQLKYNPGFHSEQELIHSFVVRKAELNLILETLQENTGASNQHLLIVGPRGSGKTTLVRRVAAAVHEDNSLDAQWYPIIFSEEPYQVLSPGEFWLEALFQLQEQTDDLRWCRVYEELQKEPDEIRLRDRALAQLMDFADEQGKRILLIVENLNMLLGEQLGKEDAWDLRHTLQNEARLMLLATATSRFEEVQNIDQAWFELLSIQELKPLDQQECRILWEAIIGEETGGIHLRPIQILTGGNPRLLRILADFAARKSFRELMDELTQLVDDHTEYFKSQLDNLAAAERKVFVTLLEIWDPVGAREVARAARMEVSKTSSLLHRLINRGAVTLVNSTGRKKLYQVAERLYNIYYLMRRRGHASNRIHAIVSFMVQFYEGEELVKSAVKLAEETSRLAPEMRKDHFRAYQGIVNSTSDLDLRCRIIQATPDGFFEGPDVPAQVQCLKFISSADRIFAEAVALVQRGDDLLKESGQVLGAERAYREAEQACRKVLELDPKDTRVWSLLGFLYHKRLEGYEEAEEAYQKALEIDPQDSWVWMLLGLLYYEWPERHEEAEEAYQKALEIDPQAQSVWAKLGLLYHERLGRYEEAEQAYQKSLEIDPQVRDVWGLLGLLYHERLGRYEEAEQAYQKVLELDPKDKDGWANLGQLYHERLGRYEEADCMYHKAIELNPKDDGVWSQLGELLHRYLKRYEEAEQAYRKVLELDPKNGWIWGQLGELLHRHLQRPYEAEQAYLTAIDLQDKNTWIWPDLIELRLEQGENPYTALQQIEEYLERYGRDASNLERITWVFYLAGLAKDFPQPEDWAREAAEKEPDDWNKLGTLVLTLGARGKWTEALNRSLPFLDAAAKESDAIQNVTYFLASAAVSGYAKEALDLVSQSKAAANLEPLIVGLKIFLGERPLVAQEIFEIGQDVAERIREKQMSQEKEGQG